MSETVSETIKRRRVLTTLQLILAAIAVVGICWLLWMGYNYLHARSSYDDIRETYVQDSSDITNPIDWDALTADYPNAVAWIHFNNDDLEIDYPVMQGDDNEFYLRHDTNGDYSIPGSVFLDYRNNSFSDDLHTIIYGHNMLDGSMFSNLSKLVDEDYFDAHDSTFWIATKDATYYYQIFSVSIVDPYSDIYTVGYKDTDVFAQFIKQIKEASLYDTGVDVSGDDRVLTLSTCQRPNRLTVSAKLVERK